jgi:hypothetical protein
MGPVPNTAPTSIADLKERDVAEVSMRGPVDDEVQPCTAQVVVERRPLRIVGTPHRTIADHEEGAIAIRSAAERDGPIAAMQQVASRPASFGEMRGVEVGPVRSAQRKDALQHVPGLSRATAEYLTQSDFARLKRPEYRAAQAAIATASGKLRNQDAELQRSPGIAELRRQIREKVGGMRPSHRRETALRLSPTQRMMLNTAMAAGLAFVREQGDER